MVVNLINFALDKLLIKKFVEDKFVVSISSKVVIVEMFVGAKIMQQVPDVASEC